MLTANFLRVAVEVRRILRDRCGEWMMRRDVAVLRLIVAHQRKIDDPQKLPVIVPDRHFTPLHEELRRLEADPAQDRARLFPRRCREENHIAFGHAELGGQRRLFRLREEFHDRRFPLAAFDFDEGESLRTERFRDFLERLELTLREIGEPLGIDRFDRATAGRRRGKHLEPGGLEQLGEVHELHAEAHIGFIHPEAVHRIVERHAHEWRRDVLTQHVLPEFLQHALEQRVDVFARDERGLDVHLRELHLPIRTQIFVAEAARDLEIFLHSRHHENLLKLLRRLRQRVELSRVNPRRHEILARTFRRALKQGRRLHFDELLGVKIITDRLRRLVAHVQILPHLRTAQIEITIRQPHVLVHLVTTHVVERKRRRVGNIMDR